MIVYILQNAKNGKRYVGQTKDLHERLHQHRYEARSKNSSPLYRALRKYAFVVEAIIGLSSRKAASTLERFLIASLQTTSHENGYNIDLGGHTAGKHSKQTRAKIGAASAKRRHSRVTRLKMSQSQKGVKRSLSTRLRNAAAAKRAWNNPIIRKRMLAGLRKRL